MDYQLLQAMAYIEGYLQDNADEPSIDLSVMLHYARVRAALLACEQSSTHQAIHNGGDIKD